MKNLDFWGRNLYPLKKKYGADIISLLWYARAMIHRELSDAEVEHICRLLDDGYTFDDIAVRINSRSR